ncbi:MAG TPA: helix-turn-helix domain-containing protein, partial [Archangium sp.]
PLTLVQPPPATPPAPVRFPVEAEFRGNGFEPLASQGPELQGTRLPTPDALIAEATGPKFPVDLPGLLRTIEELYITAALTQAGGNRKAAADLLGLQRTTLVEKLRRRSRDTQAA